MNGEQKSYVAKILSAIENETLTTDETIRRLEEIVDKELEKPEASADMELIDGCENLLWELNTNGKLPFSSHLDQNTARIMKRIDRERKQHVTLKLSLRTLVATAAAFILMVVTDGALNHGWFRQYSTEDGQQFVIEGQAIDPGFIDNGTADEVTEPVEFSSADWQQMVDFLGYTPIRPAWLPENWEEKEYYAFKSPDINTFTVFYQNTIDEAATLIFNADSYHNNDEAYETFEQNADGELVQVNDQQIYVTENMERLRYVWKKSQTLYTLTGIITCDEANQIVQSIKGAGENE